LVDDQKAFPSKTIAVNTAACTSSYSGRNSLLTCAHVDRLPVPNRGTHPGGAALWEQQRAEACDLVWQREAVGVLLLLLLGGVRRRIGVGGCRRG
jgi:hypothetical protein